MNKSEKPVIVGGVGFKSAWRPTLERFGLIDQPLPKIWVSLPKDIEALEIKKQRANSRMDGACTKDTPREIRSFGEGNIGKELFRLARENLYQPLSDPVIESVLPPWAIEVARAKGSATAPYLARRLQGT